MKRTGLFLPLFAAILTVPVCTPEDLVSGQKLSVEDIIAKHLDSIGSAQAREAVKSRFAVGTVEFAEMISRSVRIPGAAELSFTGRKTIVKFRFGQLSYPGEQFVFDGNRVDVAPIDVGSPSSLGRFIYEQTEMMSEGLLAGTLNADWALFDLKSRQAKLRYEGIKKGKDREQHAINYAPKKRSGPGELLIRLHFEPGTFRHTSTVYTITDRNSDSREIVEERFDDFITLDGITLPHHWEIHYYKEPAAKPQDLRWDVKLTKIVHNSIRE